MVLLRVAHIGLYVHADTQWPIEIGIDRIGKEGAALGVDGGYCTFAQADIGVRSLMRHLGLRRLLRRTRQRGTHDGNCPIPFVILAWIAIYGIAGFRRVATLVSANAVILIDLIN